MINILEIDNFLISIYPNNIQDFNIMMYAQKVSFPSFSFNSLSSDNKLNRYRTKTQGSKIEYKPLDISFLETEDLSVFRFFNKYKELVIDNGGLTSYINIYILSNKKNVIFNFTFNSAILTDVSTFEMSTTETSSVMPIISTTFEYESFTFEIMDSKKIENHLKNFNLIGLNDAQNRIERDKIYSVLSGYNL